MSVQQECPVCHFKQKIANKKCKCGENLDKAKRSRRVEYWVNFRKPNGKQGVKHVGKSLKEAQEEDAELKKKKRQGGSVDEDMTWQTLSEWYLGLPAVRELASFGRVEGCFKNINAVFGKKKVLSTKQLDFEAYQRKREKKGLAPATIDMEVKYAKAAVDKAFDNDILGGGALKQFRNVKKKLKKGDNCRAALVTIGQYQALLEKAPYHYRAVLVIAMNTGMRLGEIKALRRAYIDRPARMIRLPAEVVKERRPKKIPINQNVWAVLDAFPRALDHDHVIHYEGLAMIGKSSLKKNFGETCKKAGITYGRKKGVTFHDIRRTVKTNMVAAGVDEAYRNLILGHALSGMDAHYIAPTEKDLAAAMEKYTLWLNNQMGVISANVNLTVKNG